ncbi:MAG: cytochrome b561 domain-containing protein [Burkholderiaceae bacterium]
MLDWLFAPIDAGRLHDVGFYLSWHARLMVIAWVFCIPFGIIVARFFKVWPGQDWPQTLDNKTWWHLHRTLQYSACFLMAVALGLVYLASREHVLPGPHAWVGWAVLALVSAQILGAIARGTKGGPTEPHQDGSLRGDHYDRTLRRRAFETVHKATGYAALMLSVGAILSGLWQSNAPRWMWIVICSWWIAVALLYLVLQRQGLAMSSYHAIWGTDETLPGNLPRGLR